LITNVKEVIVPHKKPVARQAEPQLQPTVHEIIVREGQRDAKWTRWSIGIALVVHMALFIVHWPEMAVALDKGKQEKPKIFPVRHYEFERPPRQVQQPIPPPRTQRVPIPDPTPDEPEPLRDHTEEEPYIEDVVWVPDDINVPPPPEPEGPMVYTVGGEVTRPVKIAGPSPVYPQAAVRAHITGTVLLECLIDKAGNVVDLKPVRSLPLGLTESAMDAVSQWQFRPSTLNDKPVEVIYILKVHFNLKNH
jgi:TonB family protein